MQKLRNQRGLVSIGCVATVCAFGVLKKSTSIDDRITPMPPPALKYHGHIQVTGTTAWEDSYREGDQLYRSGKYEAAYKLWANTLKLAEAAHAENQFDDARELPIFDKLGLLYTTQSKPEGAARIYERAIVIASRTYGKDSTQVAHTMLMLSHCYLYGASKNYGKAKEVLSEAFAINEKLYGKMSIPTGDIAIAMAQLYENMNQWDKAADLWKLAVDIGNKLEPTVISCCRIGPRQGLARCYEQLGKLDQALAVHTELIDMCKQGAKEMLPTVQGSYDQCLLKMGRQPAAWTTTALPSHSR